MNEIVYSLFSILKVFHGLTLSAYVCMYIFISQFLKMKMCELIYNVKYMCMYLHGIYYIANLTVSKQFPVNLLILFSIFPTNLFTSVNI